MLSPLWEKCSFRLKIGFRVKRTGSQVGREFYKEQLYNKPIYTYFNCNWTQ